MDASKFLIPTLGVVVKSISPAVREAVEEGISKIEEAAAKTTNKIDDLAVELLKAVLDIED